MEYFTLNNGLNIPKVGFGVFRVSNEECKKVVLDAIDCGYRLIDTAEAYGNEEAVGQAIRECGIDRKELFVTTKIGRNVGYDKAIKDFEDSFNKLNIGYIDLVLVHQPYGDPMGTYRALSDLLKSGKVKAIGVSNFNGPMLANLVNYEDVIPVVDQVQIDPFNQKKDDIAYMQSKGVIPEAWGPLGQGRKDLFTNPVLKEIADHYHKSVAQVVLRWHIQRGVIVIPKSSHKERMQENIDIFDFALTDEEMNKIASLDENPKDFLYDTAFIDQSVSQWIDSWKKMD